MPEIFVSISVKRGANSSTTIHSRVSGNHAGFVRKILPQWCAKREISDRGLVHLGEAANVEVGPGRVAIGRAAVGVVSALLHARAARSKTAGAKSERCLDMGFFLTKTDTRPKPGIC
jgi:hypothetical protein